MQKTIFYFFNHILVNQLTDNLYNSNNKPDSILFLNFNYTVTIKDYFPEIQKNIPNTSIINIHSELKNKDNPIVFGYGDEEDETNFKLIEKYDECLKYMKTYENILVLKNKQLSKINRFCLQ
ncbi:AbiH family protein [uncultured Apibacter sp.]|uniref:AbiH family protein n=1 Tax=uncultured Apibacter sp. TaxID=1778616 RepID=UPI003452D59C